MIRTEFDSSKKYTADQLNRLIHELSNKLYKVSELANGIDQMKQEVRRQLHGTMAVAATASTSETGRKSKGKK